MLYQLVFAIPLIHTAFLDVVLNQGLTMVHLRIKMKEKYLRAASVAIAALAACSMLLLTAGGGSAAAEGSPEDFSPMPAQEGMSFSPYRLNCTLTDPLPGGRLTDGFGWRYHPITGNLDFHYGDDYAAAEGTARRDLCLPQKEQDNQGGADRCRVSSPARSLRPEQTTESRISLRVQGLRPLRSCFYREYYAKRHKKEGSSGR